MDTCTPSVACPGQTSCGLWGGGGGGAWSALEAWQGCPLASRLSANPAAPWTVPGPGLRISVLLFSDDFSSTRGTGRQKSFLDNLWAADSQTDAICAGVVCLLWLIQALAWRNVTSWFEIYSVKRQNSQVMLTDQHRTNSIINYLKVVRDI